ncbi:deoxyribodipyrimidine photo-lyase-like [Periplaneta americana]|uniref:deoxyribodipyrimidine photo-lyase-like n=1 Tax=Periplaneta americana TaxID=6978 RepID=UPI0037E7B447
MGPKTKKLKTKDESHGILGAASSSEGLDFLTKLCSDRQETAPSISEFKFNKKRVRVLSEASEVPERAEGVVYWMSRDQRVQDNWAMLYAQKLALKNKVPLHVCFCLVPRFLDATIRHYEFLLKGLEEVAKECGELAIEFHLLQGQAPDVLPDFVVRYNMGAVVTDFSPLRVPMKWVKDVQAALPRDVPFCQVDAHNIVPCWVASDKLEYAARTIRNKINSRLQEFLTPFPPVTKHQYTGSGKAKAVDWEAAKSMLEVDQSVAAVDWAEPGTRAGLEVLRTFCSSRLKFFASKRNDPTAEALSHLSPWFHFGQVSVQRCILVVKEYKPKYSESVDAFCEEAIVRRELADNFCFYNDKYDSLDGAYVWAKKTLNDHRKDKRQYLYTREQLEKALTHDDLWNSAQLQLVKEGKMHGFLRMYWAKKILEWTDTPERALADAIYLNDRFSLDGRDPNGFVGCMWSICGIHDQGWAERAVFGKIRYMNYEGCKRKFDILSYIARWGGKKHK